MQYQIINGRLVSGDDARIPTNDLALLRGFGAFDYFKVLAGVPVFIEDHLDRLFYSADQLGIDIPFKMDEVRAMCEKLINANDAEEGSLRVVITGGFAEDGYTPVKSNLFIMMHALPGYDPVCYTDGINLISHAYQRDIPTAKTTLYLQAMLHRKRMQEYQAIDVLYHWDGIIRETSRSNIFFLDDQERILTPKRDILGGVTRMRVIRLLETVNPVVETDIHMDSLGAIREAFLTSTTKDVMPVVRIDDHIIGDGKVGKWSTRVRKLFLASVHAYIENYTRV